MGTNYIRDNITEILEQIFMALSNIHQSDIVHGNSTLNNVGVTSNGKYVLYDFDSSSTDGDPECDYRLLQNSIRYHLE